MDFKKYLRLNLEIAWANIQFCQPSQLTLTRDDLRSHFLLSKKLPHSDLNQALLIDIAA